MTGLSATDRHASDYLPHIDGLRALAVLSVIVYHLNAAWLPGGFGGVDVFFVISGFVVSASVDRAPQTSLAGFAAFFYARRIQRIVPALLGCLLLTSLASVLLVPSSWLSGSNGRTAIFAFFGLSNLVLAATGNDYFSPKAEFNPFTHTWSLGVEEQFYLLFPLLFAGWVMRGRFQRGARLSTALFALLALVSLTAGAWLADTDPTAAFYMITGRFWELAAGALLYQWNCRRRAADPEGRDRLAPWAGTGAVLSMAAVLAGFVWIGPSMPTVPWMLVPVLGTVGLLLFTGADPAGSVRALLGQRVIVYVGRISYSLYLWHWPVFVLMRWTTGIESASMRLLALAVCFALAVVSYHAVELPLRYSARLRQWPRIAVVLAGLGVVMVSAVACRLLFLSQPHLTLSVTRDTATWYPDRYVPDAASTPCGWSVETQPLAGGEMSLYSRSGCDRPAAPARLFVLGDSHALAYRPMLQRLTTDTGVQVLLYSRGGCSFLDLRHRAIDVAPSCLQFFEGATADVARRITPRDVLFMPSLRVVRFSNQHGPVPTEVVQDALSGQAAEEQRLLAVAQAISVLRPLSERGVTIVFEAPKPIFRASPFRCADWFNRGHPACRDGMSLPRELLQEHRRRPMESLDAVSRAVPSVKVWDPFPLLCPGQTCHAFVDGKPLFFDGDHVSGYGNAFLYPDFQRFMTPLLASRP